MRYLILGAILSAGLVLIIAAGRYPPEEEPELAQETPAAPTAEATITPPPIVLPTPHPASERWRPAVRTSWQYQLTGRLDLSVDAEVFDVELFDTSAQTVAALHARGRRVVCYLSVGAWENWRPDAARFPDSVKGRPNGWPGERWLDIRRLDILMPLIEARLDQCQQKGFDGAEPDNVDGYLSDSGFPLTYEDQLRFNVAVANAARARGLAVGLKNDLRQIRELLPYFDWVLNEQCFEYNECELLLPFIEAGKPVFNVEYRLSPSEFCSRANEMNFNSLHKRLNLDAYRHACR